MITLIWTSFGPLVGIFTFFVIFAAYMTGQAMATTWKPLWHSVIYGLLLGLVDRFLGFALFEGELLSLGGYLADAAVLIGIALFAHRLNQARCMVAQYPWLYERAGPFGWRTKGAGR